MKKGSGKAVVTAGVFPIKGAFATDKDLKKAVKGMKDSELLAWITEAGLTFKPNEHANINRMRMAMAIGELHFPKAPTTPKNVSPYKALSTEELVAMAVEKSVPVEVTDDARILRMRTIVALRSAGHIG
jgi:hypothetical protein